MQPSNPMLLLHVVLSFIALLMKPAIYVRWRAKPALVGVVWRTCWQERARFGNPKRWRSKR